jgi:hypothetical protein
MGDIHTNPAERPAPATPPAASARDEFTLRIPKPGGGGPARAAVKTTEFWLTVGLVFVLLLATYLDEALAREAGWRFVTWAIMAYVISRGLAKLGNRADATHERPVNRL